MSKRSEDFTTWRAVVRRDSSTHEISSDNSDSRTPSSRRPVAESVLIDSSDKDNITSDVEITEGGWICRVERFEKYFDSHSRTDLRHGRAKEPLPYMNQAVPNPSEQRYSKNDGGKKNPRQSIICYYRHIPKAREGIVQPYEYITINSPLILEVLRANAKFGQEVRAYITLDASKAEGIIEEQGANSNGSH